MAATASTVAIESSRKPPRYRNGENSSDCQNIRTMTSSPTTPAPSIARRASGRIPVRSCRLGQTIASAAPSRSSWARVSVP